MWCLYWNRTDHFIIIFFDSDGDNNQKSARYSDIFKRRKVQKSLVEENNVFKVSRFSAFSVLYTKSVTRSSQQQKNVVKYDMRYHLIDDFMRPVHSRKKTIRLTKERLENKSTSIDIHSEILKLKRRIDEVMITCGNIQILAKRQVKLLEGLASKSS